MKIECPSCHLVGKINEVELPREGRLLNCPRCKNSFHVAKPPDADVGKRLMGSCPSCQYSTFTEEMFAVCPKCGMTADEFEERSRKQRENEQSLHDLQTDYRNPDLVKAQNDEEAPEPALAPQPVRLTAWVSIVVGCALFCYGAFGLFTYYRKDWQGVLSASLIEPVSKLSIFFSLGFIPWLITLYGIFLMWSASEFLRLKPGADSRMGESALAGMAVVAVHEIADFINWMNISSSTPSFSYYATAILSSLFLTALFGAPFFGLYWYLENGTIIRKFRKAQRLSGNT